MVQDLAEGLRDRAAARQARTLCREPGGQIFDEGAASLVADGAAHVGRLPAHLCFDRIECRCLVPAFGGVDLP